MTLYKDDSVEPDVWVLTYHSHDYYEGWKQSFAGLFASRHAINKKLTGFQLIGNAEWRKRDCSYRDDYYTAEVAHIHK